ncbi:MAG: pspC [Acidimicrobiaceae bacterium]|nr:pspC [Acidimicrobiaceae bacterium]
MSDLPFEHENDTAAGTKSEAEAEVSPRSTTLHRSHSTKVFAGVAGGIGERFDVDANIVRVVFVVLALVYGLGIAIYLALWALLPRTLSEGDDVTVENVATVKRHNRWLSYAMVLGVVALFVIFLTNLQGRHHVIGEGFGKGVAVLWLVFLAILAVVALRSSSKGFTLGRFLAVAFFSVVTFFILSIGAFLIVLQILGVPVEGGSGVKSWDPTSVAQVQQNYHGAYGASTIDLEAVPFTVGTWRINATQGVGNLTVDVPSNAVVSIRSHVGIGNVDEYSWKGTPQDMYVAPFSVVGSTLAKDAPHLELDLQVGIGQINVVRGVGDTPATPRSPRTPKTPTTPTTPAVP